MKKNQVFFCSVSLYLKKIIRRIKKEKEISGTKDTADSILTLVL